MCITEGGLLFRGSPCIYIYIYVFFFFCISANGELKIYTALQNYTVLRLETDKIYKNVPPNASEIDFCT